MDLVVGPRTTAEISEAVKARQKPVNDNISLDAYFTTADHVGIQVRAASTRAMSPRAGLRAFPPAVPAPAPVLRPGDSSPALRHRCPNAGEDLPRGRQPAGALPHTHGLLQPGGGDDGKASGLEEPETRQAVSRVRGGGPQVHGRDGENQTHHKRGGGDVSHATPGGAEGATTTRARGPPAARGARTRDFDNRGDALTAGTIHRGGMGPSLRVTGAVSGGC